jgi:hypothetical protein
MALPEEWPSRRRGNPPALQNPAYRPAGAHWFDWLKQWSVMVRPVPTIHVFLI